MSELKLTAEEIITGFANNMVIREVGIEKLMKLLAEGRLMEVFSEYGVKYLEAGEKWLEEHDRKLSEQSWAEGAKAEAYAIAASHDSFPEEVKAVNPYIQKCMHKS